MIAAAIVLAVAAVVIIGFKPAVIALDNAAARRIERLVEPVLGPPVDWDAAEEWWASQGKSHLR